MEGTPTLPIVYPRIYMAPRRRRNAIIDLFNASIHELENIELRNHSPRTPQQHQTNVDSAHPAACEQFVNTLEEVSVTEEMVSKGLECAICMEAFKENEKCVKLPCTDHPHYFHRGQEGSECSGIKPWLQRNNTCPVCRTEFPTTARTSGAGVGAAIIDELMYAAPAFSNLLSQVSGAAQAPEIPHVPDNRTTDESQQEILEERIIQIPPSLIPTNNIALTPEQIEGLQNNTNITNIIEDNQVPDIIQNNFFNVFFNGISRERTRRNEEVDIQRAIELSLAN